MLNPDRPGNPDIDVDIDYLRRPEVIHYLVEKYGKDHVAQIGTYIQMKTKSVLKDVGRLFNIDHTLINDWNKLVPVDMGTAWPLQKVIDEIDEFTKAQQKYPEMFELALQLQSMPKSASVHSCGIEISPIPLMNNIPIMRSKEGDVVTAYEGPTLEDLGYVKFDLLGLKNLSVMRIACELVKKRHDIIIDINNVEPDDMPTFKMLKDGDTQGVFQLESKVALLAA